MSQGIGATRVDATRADRELTLTTVLLSMLCRFTTWSLALSPMITNIPLSRFLTQFSMRVRTLGEEEEESSGRKEEEEEERAKSDDANEETGERARRSPRVHLLPHLETGSSDAGLGAGAGLSAAASKFFWIEGGK